MLKNPLNALSAALLLVLVAGYGYLILDSSLNPPHRPAISASYHEASGASLQNKSDETFWQRTTHDPIALYTLLLALFTCALVAVSAVQIRFLIRADKTARISAEAARRSSDAVVNMERPRVRLERLELAIGSNDKPIRHYVEAHCIKITFHNYGRSPAFLVGSHFGLYVGRKLPEPPAYGEGVDQTTVIEPGKDLSWTWISRDSFSVEQVEAIIERRLKLWMYGVLLYEGFLDQEYRTGFCGSWTNDGIQGTPHVGFAVRSRSPYIFHS